MFENARLQTFNVWGVRSGHIHQTILLNLFEIWRQEISNSAKDLVQDFKNQKLREFEFKRSRALKDKFLNPSSSNRNPSEILYTVIQYLDPKDTEGVDSENTSYLCRSPDGRIMALSLPYRITLVDGDMLTIPSDWVSENGSLSYYKTNPNDDDLSRTGRQRVRHWDIIDKDPDYFQLKNQLVTELARLNDEYILSNKKELQKVFISNLKEGIVYDIRLPSQKIDCYCAKGELFRKKSSLQTEIVTCSSCNGKGTFLGEILFKVVWNNKISSGPSKYEEKN